MNSAPAKSLPPTPVLIAGAAGRMGQLACEWLNDASPSATQTLELVGELRRGDDPSELLAAHPNAVLLDLTVAASSVPLVNLAIDHGVHPVIGTSGWSTQELSALEERCAMAQLGALWIPNFSIGAVLQMRFAEAAARWFDEASIEEAHHPTKLDAPSGTARATALRMSAASGGRHVPIRSARRAGTLAEQQISLANKHESLRLEHVVSDRRAYAPGLLLALSRVRSLSGLVRGLDALL